MGKIADLPIKSTPVGADSIPMTDSENANETVRTTITSILASAGAAAYDDDAAAATGGLTTGDLYQTTGAGAAPLNAAGILMIKQ